MIAPNKQNLLLLKSKKKLVTKGHKLLKEKRSALIIKFVELSIEGKKLEKQLSSKIKIILDNYFSSLTFIDFEKLIENLPTQPSTNLKVDIRKSSGVYIKNLKLELQSPDRSYLKPDLQKSLTIFADFLALILEYSQIRINCQEIADQILKTNRQISNLERKIEDIDLDTKKIKSTLEEISNLEKATLIKIFN